MPEELIAQTPTTPRDSSRLMVLNRNTGTIEHRIFRDITDYLNPGDVLVINDSRVIPARLMGTRRGTGAQIETVLLRRTAGDVWEVLVRPGRRATVGNIIDYGTAPDGRPLLSAEVIGIGEDGVRLLEFRYEGNNIYAVLDEIGQMPLPPYITKKLEDRGRYQTVYARIEAPRRPRPPGCTSPSSCSKNPRDGRCHRAGDAACRAWHLPSGQRGGWPTMSCTPVFSVSQAAADAINNRGGRIIAVGDLLPCARIGSRRARHCPADVGRHRYFHLSGLQIQGDRRADYNFHLPESTLLMLVSAFASREIILHAYAEAIKNAIGFSRSATRCFVLTAKKSRQRLSAADAA